MYNIQSYKKTKINCGDVTTNLKRRTLFVLKYSHMASLASLLHSSFPLGDNPTPFEYLYIASSAFVLIIIPQTLLQRVDHPQQKWTWYLSYHLSGVRQTPQADNEFSSRSLQHVTAGAKSYYVIHVYINLG
jgi:hypothetical protein